MFSVCHAAKHIPILAHFQNIPRNLLEKIFINLLEHETKMLHSDCAHTWVKVPVSKGKIFSARQIMDGIQNAYSMIDNLEVKTSDTYPVLFLSSRLGARALMYAHVQMSSKITVSKLWKLNMADCKKWETGLYGNYMFKIEKTISHETVGKQYLLLTQINKCYL